MIWFLLVLLLLHASLADMLVSQYLYEGSRFTGIYIFFEFVLIFI